MENSVNNEISRGQMDTIILLTLINGDKHTNEIRDEIENRTAGNYIVKQGTFYSCLDRIKKQGLVHEFRSSTSDGIRRKFYSLNQKGKNYLEKHIHELPYSVVNFVPTETTASSAENLPNESIEKTAETNETVNKVEVKEPVVVSKPEKVVENKQSEDEFTAFLNSAKQENDFTFINVDNFSQSDKYFDSINQQISDEINIESQSKISKDFTENSINSAVNDDENDVFDGFFTEKKYNFDAVQPSKTEQEKQETVSAFYDNNDVGPAEYKDILKKLFPDKQSAPAPAPQQIQPATTEDVIEDKIEENETYDNEEIVEKFNETSNKKKLFDKTETKNTVSTGYKYDFSDLYKMADEEGFRLKVSSSTNRSEIGKILINKLNFHTILIHFLLICLQIAVIALSVGKLLNAKAYDYLIIIGVLAIAPITSGIIYKIYPNARIKEIYLFKNAIEIALMLTLNLILIICAFAVLMNIDFNNGIQLLKYIILPILCVINIPVYVFIKYSLLDKNAYLSK